MKTFQKIKFLLVLFSLLNGNAILAQQNLNSSLEMVEDELKKLEIKYKKNNSEKGSITLAYNTDTETKIYWFKKNATNNFMCYKEENMMIFSDALLKQIYDYLLGLGYEISNYKNKFDNNVLIFDENNIQNNKHYAHLIYLNIENKEKLVITFTTSTDEFKLLKE